MEYKEYLIFGGLVFLIILIGVIILRSGGNTEDKSQNTSSSASQGEAPTEGGETALPPLQQPRSDESALQQQYTSLE